MEENVISFNLPNLITIGVIGIVMFALFGFLAQLYHNSMGTGG